MRRSLLWLIALTLLAGTPPAVARAKRHAPPRATATPEVPHGFDKATFGMSLAQVRALYPKLTPAPVASGAAYFNSPHLTRHLLSAVKISGLPAPVTVEFRFWKDQLWTVIVYFVPNIMSDVADFLDRRYRPVSSGPGGDMVLGTTSLAIEPAEMWYSLSDNALTGEVRQAFQAALAARDAARQPNPTPPPAAGGPSSPTMAAH